MAQASSKDYSDLKRLIKAIEEFDEGQWCDLPECQNGDEYALPQNALSQNRVNSCQEQLS